MTATDTHRPFIATQPCVQKFEALIFWAQLMKGVGVILHCALVRLQAISCEIMYCARPFVH